MTARMIIGPVMGVVAGVAAVATLVGCTATNNSVAPSPGTSSGTSSAQPTGPSNDASPTPSVSKTEYTPATAAAVLKEYLTALVSKDASAICALDARTSAASPKRLPMADCVNLVQGRITGKDWTNLEVDCWASAKDSAACAGMTPVAARAEPNELGNLVFDSTKEGFAYASGTPEGCDPKNSTGCWFVVVRDPDGRMSVAPHWGSRIYR